MSDLFVRLRLLVLIGIVSFICNNSLAQEKRSNIKMIEALSKLRSELLLESKEDLSKFKAVFDYWSDLEPNNELFIQFVFETTYRYDFLKVPFNEIKDIAFVWGSPAIAKVFNEEQLKVISKNSLLSALILYEVFDQEYPYQINHSYLMEELNFCEIQDGDVIADVGAGMGIFSIMLALGYDVTVYANEINQAFLNSIEGNINRYFNSLNSIIPVLGSNSEILIPDSLDKVILRYSFHHFKHKNKMLRSIKSQLKSGGRLILWEDARTKENRKDICSKSISEKDIKRYFKRNGFILLEEHRKNEALVLKYTLP